MELRMTERRWQPPPMEPKDDGKGKVTVDEKVVRKMLTVNPSMRKGRTTFQVKKALERGESVSAKQSGAAPRADAPAVAAKGAGPAPAGRELEDTIDFFVRGKSERWAEKRAELAAQRQAIDEAESVARVELGGQLTSFVALLDDRAVAASGRAALAKHAGFLSELGLSVQALLEASQRGKR